MTQVSSNGQKTLSYDNASRITGIADTSTGASNWTYGYDALDRLISGANGTLTRGWTYDANGNRLTETGTSPSTYSISSARNQTASCAASSGFVAHWPSPITAISRNGCDACWQASQAGRPLHGRSWCASPSAPFFLPSMIFNVSRQRATMSKYTRPERCTSCASHSRVLLHNSTPEEFIRVHRSHVVRLSFIAELRPMFHGDYELVLRDGQTLALSRRYKALLPAGIRDRL
jgi:YD repeat-containing protein